MLSLSRSRSVLGAFFAAGCFLLASGLLSTGGVFTGISAPQAAIAQEEDPGAAPAPAAAAPAADSTEEPKRESYLMWFYKALGIRYVIVFLLLSFSLVALIVMNMLAIRRDSIAPNHLAETFEANLNEKKFQEAYELAKNDESYMGQVLAAGMAKLSGGYDSATEAMGQVADEEGMKLDQKLAYISLIGTLAPMFGLLGTVDGMVASFQVIAQSSAAPKPSELAEGISMALVTTLVGLWLAIPAIAAYNILKMRLSKLIFDAGIKIDNLMGRFQTAKK
jgi:biopolymer transport protein ExbB